MLNFFGDFETIFQTELAVAISKNHGTDHDAFHQIKPNRRIFEKINRIKRSNEHNQVLVVNIFK